jgi:hypothetical protein
MGFKTTFFQGRFLPPKHFSTVVPHPLTWDRTQPPFPICGALILALSRWAFLLSKAQHSSTHLLYDSHSRLVCSLIFSEQEPMNSTHTQFGRLDSNTRVFFVCFAFYTLHSCTFTLETCYPQNLASDCQVTNYCYCVAMYSNDDAKTQKQPTFCKT